MRNNSQSSLSGRPSGRRAATEGPSLSGAEGVLTNGATEMDLYQDPETITLHRSIVTLVFDGLTKLIPIVILLASVQLFVPKLPEVELWSHIRLAYQASVIAIVLYEIWRYYNNVYVIGTRRLAEIQGRLGLEYTIDSTKYEDIREIKTSQSLLGRIFNYGTIYIGTPATGKYEVILSDIPGPTVLEQYIQSRIKNNAKNSND